MTGIFDVADLEKEIDLIYNINLENAMKSGVHQELRDEILSLIKGCGEEVKRIILEERQRLRSEVEKIIDEMFNDFIFDSRVSRELKKRLGISHEEKK